MQNDTMRLNRSFMVKYYTNTNLTFQIDVFILIQKSVDLNELFSFVDLQKATTILDISLI
jgi:hypothetical protein